MRQYVLVCHIFLYIAVDRSLSIPYNDYIVDGLPQLCPYSNFCTRNATKTLKNSQFSSCCKPCACDPACITRNNCCPDVSKAEVTSSPLPCLPMIHATDSSTSALTNGFYNGIHHYYTIDKCPADFDDGDDTVSKCTDPVIGNLEDIVTVSDSRVFKNRHCAKCNGVIEYNTWEMHMFCKRKIMHEDIARLQLNTLHKQKCTLYSVPPEGTNLMSSRCYRTSYKRCNITGQWQTFDDGLMKGCETYNTPYLHCSYDPRCRIYKNPFCFLCNNDPYAVLDRICPNVDMESFKDRPAAFTAILDLSGITSNMEMVKQAEKPILCKPTETLDPYFNKCRALHCPVGTAPANGQCYSPFKESFGLGLEFYIALRLVAAIPDGDINAILNEGKSAKTLVDAIMDKSKLREKGCHYGMAKLFELQAQQHFGFLITANFFTTKTCVTVDIMNDVLRNINGTSFSITLNSVNFTIYSELVYNFRINHGIAVTNAKDIFTFRYDTNDIGMALVNVKFYCACVELSSAEYKLVVTGAVAGCPASPDDFMAAHTQSLAIGATANAAATTGDVDATTGDVDEEEDIYRVCLKDYIKSSTNVGVQQTSRLLSVMTVFMVTKLIIT